MSSDDSLRLFFPRSLRALSLDIYGIVFTVALANLAAFTPALQESRIRVVSGLLFLLFVPGYSLVAALFPSSSGARAVDSPNTDEAAGGNPQRVRGSGLTEIERTVLAFGSSVTLVPVVALVMSFTRWGFGLGSLMFPLSAFSLVSIAVAAYRRRKLPRNQRYRVTRRKLADLTYRGLSFDGTTFDLVLTICLAITIAFAVTSAAYAFTTPLHGEQFSTVVLLSETNDGEHVAGDFPTDLTSGEPYNFSIAIDNAERRDVNYTLVVVEQQVDLSDDRIAVTEQRELLRETVRLNRGERTRIDHEVAPTITGSNVRLLWLVYLDDPPSEPALDTADHSVQHWTNVTT